MADRLTPEQRSKNMSAVKARGNRTTEQKLRVLLKANRVIGWRRHLKNLPGTPDFAFSKARTAVFVDGCFWHGCPSCYSAPKNNFRFWKLKVAKNRARDIRAGRELRKMGWKVVRIWEHQLRKRPETALFRVLRAVGAKRR